MLLYFFIYFAACLINRHPAIEANPMVSVEPLSPIHSHFLPHEENGCYYNRPEEVGETSVLKSTISTIFYLLQGSFERPSLGDLTFWHRTCWDGSSRSIEPKITWMGHAAVLIQMEEINLLLDPTYGFITPCFIRHTKEPIPLEKLPPIDVIIVSHNHADHFDKATIKKIARKQTDFWGNPCDLPNVFIPHQLEKWFQKNGYPHASGKKWWERSVVQREGRQVILTALPAHHWSQSNLRDKNRSLWMGVMIESEDFRIYFAGDTGFDQKMFEEIRKQFGTIDIAILPIAPEGYCKNHLSLEQALDAFQLLGAKRMIPVHYGAYRTGTEKIEEPLIRLLEAIQVRGLREQVLPLPLGGTYDLLLG